MKRLRSLGQQQPKLAKASPRCQFGGRRRGSISDADGPRACSAVELHFVYAGKTLGCLGNRNVATHAVLCLADALWYENNNEASAIVQCLVWEYGNKPEVWEYGNKKCLVEPRIQGIYHKFNSNTGWVRDQSLVTEALSHFSYHCTTRNDGQSVEVRSGWRPRWQNN